MSPTIFRYRGYRYFFFSREESRVHVHVSCADGEAKFWMLPEIELAENHGLSAQQLNHIRQIVVERRNEILRAWREHFGG